MTFEDNIYTEPFCVTNGMNSFMLPGANCRWVSNVTILFLGSFLKTYDKLSTDRSVNDLLNFTKLFQDL